MAHLLELTNKINLSREDYLTVQQSYRGWNLLGTVVAAALISALVLTITLRGEQRVFVFALIGLLCLVGTQVVFWTYTYPTNQITNNWTMLGDNWMQLRRQWEYSHATSAVLNRTGALFTHRVCSRAERALNPDPGCFELLSMQFYGPIP